MLFSIIHSNRFRATLLHHFYPPLNRKKAIFFQYKVLIVGKKRRIELAKMGGGLTQTHLIKRILGNRNDGYHRGDRACLGKQATVWGSLAGVAKRTPWRRWVAIAAVSRAIAPAERVAPFGREAALAFPMN